MISLQTIQRALKFVNDKSDDLVGDVADFLDCLDDTDSVDQIVWYLDNLGYDTSF